MKMALSEFALREKGIYGVLHIVILLLSLFLVVSISVDTFKGIPFYTQTVFMKVQFAVCILFLLDFILEWFLAKHKGRYFATHFVFLLVARALFPGPDGRFQRKSLIYCVLFL